MAIEMTDQYCCEEHFPSDAMTPAERAEHDCPVCSWSPTPESEYRACLVRCLNSLDRMGTTPAVVADIERTLTAWRT